MAAIAAQAAEKAGPNIVIAPILCCCGLASAITAVVFSIMCGLDVKKSKSGTKTQVARDCSLTGIMWCLCLMMFSLWALNAYTGVQKAMS